MTPIPHIAVHTRAILGGEFIYYPQVVAAMTERYPELDEFIAEMDALSDRIDLDRYVREEVIPSVEARCTLINCKEWIVLMRSRIVGPY